MAPPQDLREWIALLERGGELVRVSAEVDRTPENTVRLRVRSIPPWGVIAIDHPDILGLSLK